MVVPLGTKHVKKVSTALMELPTRLPIPVQQALTEQTLGLSILETILTVVKLARIQRSATHLACSHLQEPAWTGTSVQKDRTLQPVPNLARRTTIVLQV